MSPLLHLKAGTRAAKRAPVASLRYEYGRLECDPSDPIPSIMLLLQRERRVTVGDQQQCIGLNAQCPAHHSNDEMEQHPRVLSGEQDGEPGDDRADQTEVYPVNWTERAVE
jgi:hypothetical protein